jgi:cytosine/adenosine deaminase-related metal-dependent hydrolase
MTSVRAAWACPIDGPPVRDAVIEVEGGIIHSVSSGGRLPAHGARDLGNVVVLPGLVNAHTHLELSWMRDRVPPAATFTDWVTALFVVRGRPAGGMSDGQIAAIPQAIAELQASGTVAVGDISNSLRAVEPMRAAGLDGVVFHELLGFKERDGGLIEATRDMRAAAAKTGARVSLAPHAPYSTSLELFTAIRTAVSGSACQLMSVHLGESPEETEFLQHGTGPWRGMLEAIGVWRDDWAIPACDPVRYLDRHGVLDARTLVVHGVQFSDAALGRVRDIGATLVTCPRSNRWVGVGNPPVDRFYRSGVNVAVGTDSLASVSDLNLFSELSVMRRLAPHVPASRILESATLTGARALGLEGELGSLAPGKQAKMIAVRLPDGITDVEEFLLSGITPASIELLTH